MENASKALIIAGAILISILIIAIGMGIYNKSKTAVDDAGAGMETSQIEAFNSEWTNYEGVQTGSQVKAMINKLIAHANTYQEEEGKVIGITCNPDNGGDQTIAYDTAAADPLPDFITALNGLYSDIQPKHRYFVTVDYQGSSLIREMDVAYDIP